MGKHRNHESKRTTNMSDIPVIESEKVENIKRLLEIVNQCYQDSVSAIADKVFQEADHNYTPAEGQIAKQLLIQSFKTGGKHQAFGDKLRAIIVDRLAVAITAATKDE